MWGDPDENHSHRLAARIRRRGTAACGTPASAATRINAAGSTFAYPLYSMATQALAKLGMDLGTQHPKSWDRFVREPFDYVITVCDKAAESCPVFPGAAERVHWSFDDPAQASGTPEERQRVFDQVAKQMTNRIRIWMALPKVGGRIRS